MTKNKTRAEVPIFDIKIRADHLFELFKHHDTVVAVCDIIKFCILENKNRWYSFDKEAINTFCSAHFKREFNTNRLVASGYLRYRKGKYIISKKLFEICQKSIEYKVKPP